MAVKYVKSTHNDPLDKGMMGKMQLTVKGESIESIWVRRFDGYSVLQNHAFNLFPFESWGAVVPFTGTTYDLSTIMDTNELELHADAFDQYVAAGIIKEDGSYIKPADRAQPPKPEKKKRKVKTKK